MPASILTLALCALALVIVVLLWLRRRATRLAATPVPAPTPRVEASPPAPTPAAATSDGSFDPDATQMYMRPAKAAAPAGQRQGTVVAGARLVCLSGSQKGSTFALSEAGLTVGRNPACDIVLGDSRVSGRHAWLGLIGGKAIVRDLGSSNGTFLNTGTRAVGDTELCANDTIFFGGHQGDQFRFVAE